MPTTIPITKARINLGAIVKRVSLRKEKFILEKDGYPVAILIDIDEYEDFIEQRNPRIQRILKESHRDYLAGRVQPADKLLEELKTKYNEKNKKRI
ncbi:MAG: type II toxin-antitoxin system Phd/YefM family antitoxin [Candidatus Pacebacteria bacterium]|nr:type II toxin-antitoxin system Phd/YefM family antitoxin [Candidatus Paceibacterota bacterium]